MTGNLQSNPQNAIPVYVTAPPSNVSGGAGGVAAANAYTYRNITAGATTVVKSGAGVLGGIIVNNPGTTITATVYDNTAGSGTKIATLSLAAGMNLIYDVAFAVGLTIVTSGTCDITVAFA